MPCFDGRDSVRTEYQEMIHNGKNAARMCGILKVLETKGILTKVLDAVDWKDAGVTRKGFDKWWADHKKHDAFRKKEEEAARKRKAEEAKKYRLLKAKKGSDLTKEDLKFLLNYSLEN